MPTPIFYLRDVPKYEALRARAERYPEIERGRSRRSCC